MAVDRHLRRPARPRRAAAGGREELGSVWARLAVENYARQEMRLHKPHIIARKESRVRRRPDGVFYREYRVREGNS